MSIDAFATKHEHAISLLEAVSTFAVVITSILLALFAKWSSRTKISCRAIINRIAHNTIDNNNPPRYLVAIIRNEGIMPVRIPLSHFHWLVPLRKGAYTVLPHDYSAADPLIAQKRYPYEIAPRATQTFILSSLDVFRVSIREMLTNPARVNRLLTRFIGAKVLTDDAKFFGVSIDPSVRREIKQVADEMLS